VQLRRVTDAKVKVKTPVGGFVALPLVSGHGAAQPLVRGEPPLIALFLLADPPTWLGECWRRRRQYALYLARDDLTRSGLVDDELRRRSRRLCKLLTLGDARRSLGEDDLRRGGLVALEELRRTWWVHDDLAGRIVL
jgi:hypothetical protein